MSYRWSGNYPSAGNEYNPPSGNSTPLHEYMLPPLPQYPGGYIPSRDIPSSAYYQRRAQVAEPSAPPAPVPVVGWNTADDYSYTQDTDIRKYVAAKAKEALEKQGNAGFFFILLVFQDFHLSILCSRCSSQLRRL